MRILCAILTSRDLPRAQRAVESARMAGFPDNDIMVVINTTDNVYEQRAWKQFKDRFHTVKTYSDGRPGRGKNHVLNQFLETTFTHVFQVDGDDHLHKNARMAMEHDLRLDPEALLIAYQIVDLHAERQWWVDGLAFPSDQIYGPGLSEIFTNSLPTCWWMPRLFSRVGAKKLRFDETLGVGEDHALMIDALRLHQRLAGRVWVSRSTDVYCIDRGAPGRTQNTTEQSEHVARLRALAGTQERSSPWELPVIFSYPLTLISEKAKYCTELDQRNLT